MTWNSIMGFISTLALFFPILLILIFRLGTYKSFPILLFYYLIVFIFNLMEEGYINASADVVYVWGISNNLLDIPLILLFLSYFSPSALFTKRLKALILLYILFEIIVVSLVGFNVNAITIILGPGLLMVFSLSIYFFIRHSKVVITNHKALGKTLIIASLAFAYGCYGFLYIMFYIVKTSLVADVFLIYFFVITFSSICLCSGIIYERKRIQKLFELKKARKELHDIYKDPKPVNPFRTPMLDFDREPWN